MWPALIGSFLIGMATSSLVYADPAFSGENFGDWQYECAPAPLAGTNCALVQVITDPDTNLAIARLSFARNATSDLVIGSVLLPLGVDLMESALVHTRHDTLLLTYRMCRVEGCLARKPLLQSELLDVAHTDRLGIEFHGVGLVEPIIVVASSKGLAEAFEILGFSTKK